MPVVQELMQQQGPLGPLAPVGQSCLYGEAQAPAAVEQILQLVLQPFGADGVIEHICGQPDAGQLGVLGRAVAAQLLLKQRLELTEAAATCLLQGQGDVAVGEIGPLEQLIYVLGLEHLTQVAAGTADQLDLEGGASAEQLQQHGAAFALLAIR